MTRKQLKELIKECVRESRLMENRSQLLKITDNIEAAKAFSEIMTSLQSEHDVRFYNNYSERMSDFLYEKVRRGD
jgi:hypothetical protein